MTKENTLVIFLSNNDTWIKKDAGKTNRFLNELGRGVSDVGRGVREHAAPIRWINEKLFSGYGAQMEQLREIDEQINHWTNNLDNILDHAKDARKQGRYLDVFYWLNQINNRLRLAHEAAKDFVDVNQEQFDEFFGKTRHGIQPDYFGKLNAEDIVDPDQSFEDTVASCVKDEIIKNSGIVQDLGERLTTWKMERMYKKRLQEMKRAMDLLIGETSRTVGNVYALLARMSKARAKGDISGYLEALNKISLQQQKFEKQVRTVYNSNGFKEMAGRVHTRNEKAKEIVPEIPTPSPEPKEVPAPIEQPEPEPFVHTPETFMGVPASPFSTPVEPKPEKKKEKVVEDVSVPETGEIIADEAVNKVLPPAPVVLPPAPKQQKNKSKTKRSAVEEAVIKNGHGKFYKELEKASKNSSTYLMATMILKYSEQIDEIDPEKSLELLAIAEGILNA